MSLGGLGLLLVSPSPATLVYQKVNNKYQKAKQSMSNMRKDFQRVHISPIRSK
jgi:hypothetical protein